MGIPLQDMDQVEPLSGGALLPVGWQHVTIVKADDEGTSSGGHPQVELEFVSKIGLGSLRDWIVFAPPKIPGQPSFAMQQARSLLDAAMIEPQGGEWEFPTGQLLGKDLWILVAEEPKYNDPTKLRKVVQAYSDRDQGSAPGDTTSDFGAGGQADDDIPF